DTLIVGAPGEDSVATGVNGDQNDDSTDNSSAAYVFHRDSNGDWTQAACLKRSNINEHSPLGTSLAMDNDMVAVGALYEGSSATGLNGDQTHDCDTTTNCADESGAVYVFRQNAGSLWAQQAYVKASNTGVEDRFGESLALDGNTLAVAATGEDSAATGVNGNQVNDCEISNTN